MTIRHIPERDATASQADTAPPTAVTPSAAGAASAVRPGPSPRPASANHAAQPPRPSGGNHGAQPPGPAGVDHAGPTPRAGAHHAGRPPATVRADHAGQPSAFAAGPDLTAMLEARTIALVGASPRPGTFGQRMLDEVTRSPSRPEVYPVNPRYAEIGGRRCVPSLADLPEPVDLVLLAVPDAALEQQLTLAARRGDRSAVIFGNAHEAPASAPTHGHPTPAAVHPATTSDHPATTRPPLGNPAAAHPPLGNPAATHPPLGNPTAPSSNAITSSHPAATHPDASRPDPGSSMYQKASSYEPIGTSMPGAGEPAEVVGAVGTVGTVGTVGPLRGRLAMIARSAGMQLCGAGCMGFVNVARGLRAIGYTEQDPLPAGPVALVTHSGSVFSMMLRTGRAIGYSLAVSSGQELVTAAPSYLDYALGLPETRVLALVLEAIREPGLLRQVLARSAERDIPVVLLTAGRSASGRALVTAHSGALAADDGGWEALARAYGVHRVGDLAELADALELFAIGRRVARRGQHGSSAQTGIATVHDSGLERAHAADLADECGVPFAAIDPATKARLTGILDPGLTPGNPLDVWGTGADTRGLFTNSLVTLAEDPSVDAVALAVDLVHELDGDESYRLAVLDAAAQTTKPLVVLGNVASAVDTDLATQLRQHGVPVLEGLRTGLLALRHLLDHARFPTPAVPALAAEADTATAAAATASSATATAIASSATASPATASPATASSATASATATTATPRPGRRERGANLLAAGITSGPPLLALLAEYGITTAAATEAGNEAGVLAAAESIGYPVVLKTADPAIAHKSDVRGVILGIPGPAELARAYADLSARLGPLALVCENVQAGTELAVGIAPDPDLGPLIVVGAGGVLVESLADRAVALPPVDELTAAQMIEELRVHKLLSGVRGAPPADLGAIARAVASVSALAVDLGDRLLALDVNPLICGPDRAIAVDALAVPVAALRRT